MQIYILKTNDIVLCQVGILYKKKTPPPPNPFSFLQPLSIEVIITITIIITNMFKVWIYTTTAYLALAITLFCLARISPYEWDDDGEGSATNVCVINSIIVIIVINTISIIIVSNIIVNINILFVHHHCYYAALQRLG